MLTLEDNKNPVVTTENQNQLSRTYLERNQDIEAFPPNMGPSERLMNTKIVRIRPGTTCAFTKSCRKLMFYINTISKIDNQEPANENETPLFYVEEELPCYCLCFGNCSTFYSKFNIFDANTKELFSSCSINSLDKIIEDCCGCCGESYINYSLIINSRPSIDGKSYINRHDSRSFYRTYEIAEQSYYKIGEPYVEKEPPCCKCNICCCFIDCCNIPVCCTCCCNCKDVEVEKDKRRYIDIFNMQDQPVGKFVYLFEKGVCCVRDKNFFEIYFPPDANEMLRLALIGQIIYFVNFEEDAIIAFTNYPGRRDNIEQFMS